MRQLCALIFSTFLIISCSNDSGQLVDKSETPPPAPTVGSVAGGALPQGHPPINNMDRTAMEVREQPEQSSNIDGTTANIAGLTFTIAEEWQSTPPSSMMRAAQFTVPAADGDSEGGELVLFQGIGGSAKANIDRWAGQFTNQSTEPEFTQNEVGPFAVYTIDVNGNYSASMGPMMSAQTVNKTNYRMLAAVVEGAGGPWHFKLTGPSATLDKWKPAFMTMLDTLKPAN